MINCKKVLENIEDLVEGNLKPETEQLLEQHISQCEKCDAYVHNYKVITKVFDSMTGSSSKE